MTSKSEFLQVALEAAQNAEAVIMRYYSDELQAELKPDQTPVTIADKQAEEAIIETIRNRFPDHGFLGEESGDAASKSGYQWIIDPIDGTKNYIRKIPLFATQLALMKDNELILGVSNCPLLRELLYAEKGKGAFMNGKPIHVSQVNQISDAMVCHGGLDWFKKQGVLPNMCDLIGDVSRSRGFGDFYIFHTLASGRADIAIEAADLKAWDIAALAVIIEEAGGKVTNMQGHPIDRRPTPVIATNQALHGRVLEYFSDASSKMQDAGISR